MSNNTNNPGCLISITAIILTVVIVGKCSSNRAGHTPMAYTPTPTPVATPSATPATHHPQPQALPTHTPNIYQHIVSTAIKRGVFLSAKKPQVIVSKSYWASFSDSQKKQYVGAVAKLWDAPFTFYESGTMRKVATWNPITGGNLTQ